MCTAMSYKTAAHYFGRTLDYERGYGEQVIITPRRCPLHFRRMDALDSHSAIIGMAVAVGDQALYYDAANEHGLAMAGLNFPGNACYYPETAGKDNIAPFELMPWVLGQCKSTAEARSLLERINICNIAFSNEMPLSPLHWIISDGSASITVETLRDGMRIHDNPLGILTNNPPFDYHMTHLCDFMGASAKPVENQLGLPSLKPYSRGMGGMGLPGDWSSASRFVRAAFVKLSSVCGAGENESVSQFFHLLGAVEHTRGCVQLEDGSYEITRYTSCINADTGVYYYKTYENSGVCAVDMHRCDLDSSHLYAYPLIDEMQPHYQN